MIKYCLDRTVLNNQDFITKHIKMQRTNLNTISHHKISSLEKLVMMDHLAILTECLLKQARVILPIMQDNPIHLQEINLIRTTAVISKERTAMNTET